MIKVLKKKTNRPSSVTDIEARTLMDAVLAIPADTPAGTLDAAKRWTTLLCLYSGARIGEVTQLRKSDFHTDAGHPPWFAVSPDAGTVKTGLFRKVPVHPRLVSLGLLDFVRSAKDGPLFYDPANRRKADAKTPQAQLVAGDISEWSRTVGLSDPLLEKPMHGLRHRFMTCARRAGVEEQYISAIVGHSANSQNRRYGEYEIEVLAREIIRLEEATVEAQKVHVSV